MNLGQIHSSLLSAASLLRVLCGLGSSTLVTKALKFYRCHNIPKLYNSVFFSFQPTENKINICKKITALRAAFVSNKCIQKILSYFWPLQAKMLQFYNLKWRFPLFSERFGDRIPENVITNCEPFFIINIKLNHFEGNPEI